MDKIFKAFADQNRRKIITLLKDKSVIVNDMLPFLDIKQATLSSHLSILKKAGLVSCQINGKTRIYKLNMEVIVSFVKELNRFINSDLIKVKDEIIVRRITN